MGPGIPDIRAQNDFLRGPPCGCGAFKLLPVAALYLARPLAVKPAPLDTGNFSPLPTDRTGPFFFVVVLAIYNFQFGLVDIFQHRHHNFFTEIALKHFLPNVG